MQIVIDIPKDIYEDIMVHNRERRESGKSAYYFEGLIQNGTPLPKGYGQSIDADIIINEFYERYPKNYMGGLELNGSSCVFSYNEIIEIINNIINMKNKI